MEASKNDQRESFEMIYDANNTIFDQTNVNKDENKA